MLASPEPPVSVAVRVTVWAWLIQPEWVSAARMLVVVLGLRAARALAQSETTAAACEPGAPTLSDARPTDAGVTSLPTAGRAR